MDKNYNENPIIGIDLGTTNSSAAIYNPISRKAENIRNEEGLSITPSAVSFENNGKFIVGGEEFENCTEHLRKRIRKTVQDVTKELFDKKAHIDKILRVSSRSYGV